MMEKDIKNPNIEGQYPTFENVQFQNESPFRLKRKDLSMTDFATPHYAETLEILIINSGFGIVWIGSVQYEAKAKDVYVIPPGAIHSTYFEGGSAEVYVFKFLPKLMSPYLNLEKIFESCGYSWVDIPAQMSQCYDDICKIIFHQMPYDGKSALANCRAILRLLNCFDSHIKEVCAPIVSEPNNDVILEAMEWTKKNMLEKISVSEVAKSFGYSEYYFCRMFKKNTGVTYLHYLNTLRIHHAIDLMREGHSATYCCCECGFVNLSYFLKLFREITGYSTREYKRMLKNHEND